MTVKVLAINPALALEEADKLMREIADRCAAKSTEWSTGSTVARVAVFQRQLPQHSIRLQDYQNVPGMLEYARAQKDDLTYDFDAELAAYLALITTATILMNASLPRSVDDWIEEYNQTVLGVVTYFTVTGSQLTAVRAALDNVANFVE
jgi:hypothetical protein